ncbi:MAG: membrane protein [Acidimicrobiales bacterium]
MFDVAKQWYYGGIGDLAAGVTFWILLSLPATALALVSALGSLQPLFGQDLTDDVHDDLVEFVERVFDGAPPQSLLSTIDDLFVNQNSAVTTVSLLFALWTISRGFAGLLRALDGVYEVQDGRPWYYTRVVALVIGLGSVLISAPIVLLDQLVWNEYDVPLETTLATLTSVTILVLWAATVYHFGPSIRTRWKWDLPGALVAAVMWWLLTLGFGYYVRLTSADQDVLGALGAFILALTWVWLAAQVLLIGAAVNSILGDRWKINREKRSWNLNERLSRTGEMMKIVIDGDREPRG